MWGLGQAPNGSSWIRGWLVATVVLCATVTACGSSSGEANVVARGGDTAATSPAVTNPPGDANAADPAPSDTAAAESASATPTSLSFDLPLRSAKGYGGTLQVSSPLPQVTLGDPGRITVSGLNSTTGNVSDETVGGRDAYITGMYGLIGVDVRFGWKLPARLVPYAVIPEEGIQNCNPACGKLGRYLYEQVDLSGPEGVGGVPVTANQPVTLTPVSVRGLTLPMLTDRRGFPFGFGSGRVTPDFPETERATLTALIAQPPDVVYFVGGYAAGFSFGGPTNDTMIGACGGVYGVIDGHTGKAVQWPEVKSVPGQPCHP